MTTVGMVGVGIMGSAMAGHLLDAGFPVTGYDLVRARLDELVARGGEAAGSAAELASGCDVVVLSVDTVAGFKDVVAGLQAGARPGLTVVDTNTLPVEVKEEGRRLLEDKGAVMLDCTLSGTGAQAARRDLIVYGSGPREAFERCLPVLEAFSRSVEYVGEFGTGSKMKFVANLLVAIHNVAAAEAFVLGRQAGLDPQRLYDLISQGAGTSRMFEVRGPMMVEGDYDKGSARLTLFMKDLDVIGAFARAVAAPVPLFSATLPLYTSGMAQGLQDLDPASVHAVLDRMAGPHED